MAPSVSPSDFVGRVVADFVLEVADETGVDRRTSLHELIQTSVLPVVLDFFAPWCKACPAAAEKMDRLAGEHGDKCMFILINVDGGAKGAREFAKYHGISRCVLAAAEEDEDLMSLCGVQGLPHLAILSSDMTVIKNFEVELPIDLEQVLGDGESPQASAVFLRSTKP